MPQRIYHFYSTVLCSEPGARNPWTDTQDLYAVDEDGSNRALIATDVVGMEVLFSADGQSIAFESTAKDAKYRSFACCSLDGSNRRDIPFKEFLTYGQRSYDGRYIVYGTTEDIYVLKANGELHKRLLLKNCQNPHFLADGRLGFCTWSNPGTTTRLRRAYYTVSMDNPDAPPKQLSPRGFDLSACTASPDGRYVVFEMSTWRGLYVMAIDGRKVWELTPGPLFFCCAAWSPDGSKLVASLAENQKDFGTYVIDLKTGRRTLIALEQGYLNKVWMPDGKNILTFWSGYRDPHKRVHSGKDIYMFAADGSSERRITTGDRSAYPMLIPSGPPIAGPTLDFSWARVVFDQATREAARGACDPSVVARWALLDADPSKKPPFTVWVGLQSTADHSMSETLIENCTHIPNALAKLEEFLKERNLWAAEDFTLIYPRYNCGDDLETTMNYLAGIVLEAAEKRNWYFAREIPKP